MSSMPRGAFVVCTTRASDVRSHWHMCGEGKIHHTPHVSPGRRGGATARSALGWYIPSKLVSPRTLAAVDVKCTCGYLITYFGPVQFRVSSERSYGLRVLYRGSWQQVGGWVLTVCKAVRPSLF